MSVKSSSSLGSEPCFAEVMRTGYLRKLKTMGKKFFVLRVDTADSPARLEYYDNDKKFRAGQAPKRSISLRACFNINRRYDTKHKHVIALYTHDDCFCLVLESERDLNDWLKALLVLQHGEELVEGEPPRPTFEHVWSVKMLNKGLGSTRNILGAYHLCLTDKTLSLVRRSTNHSSGPHNDHIEFSLMSIRCCGHTECFFYMEVGRSSMTGAGELWMQTEDTNIAQNMREAILSAMSNNNSKEECTMRPRTKSGSANESSKPVFVQRRQTHSGATKSTSYCSPNQDGTTTKPVEQASLQQDSSSATNVGYSNISTPTTHQAGMTGVRERCDSMPSRARTASEGTTNVGTILHSLKSYLPHRPQSLYDRGISHSPPAGSPASPASAACSTDSAGSSLSIDETDGWSEYIDHPHMARYVHSTTPDEPIAEENCDEGTDNPYVPVSPSSETPIIGGYVPMAPLSSDDGYVDMSPRGRHSHIDMSPAASTCSITSGTPSTDMRFSEYHLEKVTSYFTPSEEDDTSSADRPIRAYSVGSRPEILRAKAKMDASSMHHENSRVRAFSVGSRSKGIPSRVLPPHGHHHPSTGTKSSSAPILSSSHSHMGSHSSMEPMDDLMEMDFSRPTSNSQNSGYVEMSPRTRTAPQGYVEMKPGIPDLAATTPELPYMDMRPSASPVKPCSIPIQPDTSRDNAYMDMRPTMSPLKPTTPLQCPNSSRDSSSSYMDMRPSTSPHKPSSIPKHNSYYAEMPTNKLGTSPKNNKTTSPIQEEYMDMDFKSAKNARNTRTLSGVRTQPVDLPQTKRSPEGYIEMSWSRHQRKSSLDSAKINVNNHDDYMNMSSVRKKEKRSSKKEKQRSQPITIHSTSSKPTASSQSPVTSFSSFLPGSSRKSSTETPPKHPPTCLPLASSSYSPSTSPFSSLRRPRSRKNSRRDSSNSSGLITPTSESSTIFPFSPGSPMKPFQTKSPEYVAPRKCAVDASSGTLRLADSSERLAQSESDYARMSFDFSDKVSSPDYTEMDYAKPPAQRGDVDYVDFCPGMYKPKPVNSAANADFGEYTVMRPISFVPANNNSESNVRKTSLPQSSQSALTQRLSSLSMNHSTVKPCCFKPIDNPKEDNRLGATSPRPGDVAPHRSHENIRGGADCNCVDRALASQPEQAEGNYELLRGGDCVSPIAKVSRPNSVNSEKLARSNSRPGSVSSDKSTSRPGSVSSEITKGSLSRPSSVSSELGSTSSTIVGSRPSSVNSDRIPRPSSVSSEREMHYASLDLATTEDDGTRSPRGVKTHENTRSPTPSSANVEPTFTYAEIDFFKCESMKHVNMVNNAKVKH